MLTYFMTTITTCPIRKKHYSLRSAQSGTWHYTTVKHNEWSSHNERSCRMPYEQTYSEDVQSADEWKTPGITRWKNQINPAITGYFWDGSISLWQFFIPIGSGDNYWLIPVIKRSVPCIKQKSKEPSAACRSKERMLITWLLRSLISSIDHLPSCLIQTNIIPVMSQVASFW